MIRFIFGDQLWNSPPFRFSLKPSPCGVSIEDLTPPVSTQVAEFFLFSTVRIIIFFRWSPAHFSDTVFFYRLWSSFRGPASGNKISEAVF